MKRKSFILPFILVALIAVSALSGCSGKQEEPQTDTPPAADTHDIGEGSVVFRFEVTDNTDTVTAWNIRTEETTVGAALLEAGLVDGDVSAFGLFVTEVNGLTADYNADQSWWAFYIDGEMSITGVDTTDIEPDKVYAFVYTQG